MKSLFGSVLFLLLGSIFSHASDSPVHAETVLIENGPVKPDCGSPCSGL